MAATRSLDDSNRLLAEAQAQSAELTARQAELLSQIHDLKQERTTLLSGQENPLPSDVPPTVNNPSSQEAKIALFRSLFRGREDVYPRRFESRKTGKTGYQPACRNSWPDDTRAFLETCHQFNVPAALERSRSGNGGHVWIFFSEPVPAVRARKVGAFLLTQTMERRPETPALAAQVQVLVWTPMIASSPVRTRCPPGVLAI